MDADLDILNEFLYFGNVPELIDQNQKTSSNTDCLLPHFDEIKLNPWDNNTTTNYNENSSNIEGLDDSKFSINPNISAIPQKEKHSNIFNYSINRNTLETLNESKDYLRPTTFNGRLKSRYNMLRMNSDEIFCNVKISDKNLNANTLETSKESKDYTNLTTFNDTDLNSWNNTELMRADEIFCNIETTDNYFNASVNSNTTNGLKVYTKLAAVNETNSNAWNNATAMNYSCVEIMNNNFDASVNSNSSEISSGSNIYTKPAAVQEINSNSMNVVIDSLLALNEENLIVNGNSLETLSGSTDYIELTNVTNTNTLHTELSLNDINPSTFYNNSDLEEILAHLNNADSSISCTKNKKPFIVNQPKDTYNFSYSSDIKRNNAELVANNSTKSCKKYVCLTLTDLCHEEKEYYVRISLYETAFDTADSNSRRITPHLLVESAGTNSTIKNFKPIVKKMVNKDGVHSVHLEKFHIFKAVNAIEFLNKLHYEEVMWETQCDHLNQNEKKIVENMVLKTYDVYNNIGKKCTPPNLCICFTIFEWVLINGQRVRQKVCEPIFSNTMQPCSKINKLADKHKVKEIRSSASVKRPRLLTDCTPRRVINKNECDSNEKLNQMQTALILQRSVNSLDEKFQQLNISTDQQNYEQWTRKEELSLKKIWTILSGILIYIYINYLIKLF